MLTILTESPLSFLYIVDSKIFRINGFNKEFPGIGPKFWYPQNKLDPLNQFQFSAWKNRSSYEISMPGIHRIIFYLSALILNFVFRSLFKIIKVLIIVITSQTFECFWISVTRIRSNHVNRNWYSAGQEIISIEDYLLLPFNSTELLEPHCKHAPSKQTAWISHSWAKQYFKGFTVLQSGLMMRLFDLERVISWQNY